MSLVKVTLNVEPTSAKVTHPVRFYGNVTGPGGVVPVRATVKLEIYSGNVVGAQLLKTFEQTVLGSYEFQYAFSDPGTYNAQVTATGLLWTATSNPVVIEVEPETGTVYGYVYDAVSGQALNGVLVGVNGKSIAVMTDASGKYEMTVPTGTQTLTAMKSGYTSVQQNVVVQPDATQRLDFRLTPTNVVVYGYVKNASTGAAVSGATVSTAKSQSYSDSTGYYELLGESPGTVTVTVSAPGYETLTETITVVAGNNRKDFSLTPKTGSDAPGTIFGKVTFDATGAAAPGPTIIVDGHFATTGDDSGNYKVDASPGTHNVYAEWYKWYDNYYYDYYKSDEATVNVTPGGSVRQDFAVKYVATYGRTSRMRSLRPS